MDPHPHVLSRDNSDGAPALSLLGNLLDEVVNFGTHVFSWCLEATPVQPPNLVVSTFVHQFVETLDGAAVLIREACSEPAKLVLRSAFESMLGLLYILEADTDRRVRCYRFEDYQRRLSGLKGFDVKTPEGRDTQRMVASDSSGFSFSSFSDTSVAVKHLEEVLKADPKMMPIEREWRTAKRKNRSPTWFSLSEGPKNIKELARHLGFGVWYVRLYAPWSATMHARDALARFEVQAESDASIRGMRPPDDLQVLTAIAVSMALRTYRTTIQSRVPSRDQDLKTWYLGVKDDYGRVSDPEPLIRFKE